MWPEDEILQPEMNPWKPEPKPQARNPTRTMKKVARPSPNFSYHFERRMSASEVENRKKVLFWMTQDMEKEFLSIPETF